MELEFLKWLNVQLRPIVWLNYSMKYISLLLEGGALCILLCAVLFVYKPTRGCALYLVLSLILNVIIVNLILKNLVARPRPYTQIAGLKDFYLRYGITLPYDYSFPSGHTSAAFCMAASVNFYCGNKNAAAYIILYVLAALVGLSRIILCVHYPTDVLCGALVGVFCAAAVNLLRHAKRRA